MLERTRKGKSPNGAPVMQWEYKTIKIGFFNSDDLWPGGVFDVTKFDEMLNNLGRERWELVSCCDARADYDGGTGEQVIAIFKRQLEVDDDDPDEGWERK
jgi:hypothetical protein